MNKSFSVISLKEGLRQLSFPVSEQQYALLAEYIALLQKWNTRMNLIARGDVPKIAQRHLLDSLAIAPFIQGERIIDVGTGAGFPGIPLSILLPAKSFFLLDSNQKRQIFVNHVVKALSLSNAECLSTRVEAYQPTEKFSTILTRAFAPLAEMLPLTAHLLMPGGCWLAMLGKRQMVEQIPSSGYQLKQVVSLHVPGEEGERHLAIISQK